MIHCYTNGDLYLMLRDISNLSGCGYLARELMPFSRVAECVGRGI